MEKRFSKGSDDNRQSPVQPGEQFNVRIDAVGEKGDGIARKNGFVLFVPNTKAGDNVKIKVTKVLAKVGFAEVVGEADGPVDEGRGKRFSGPREEFHARPAPKVEEPRYQDTDNFGEEEGQ